MSKWTGYIRYMWEHSLNQYRFRHFQCSKLQIFSMFSHLTTTKLHYCKKIELCCVWVTLFLPSSLFVTEMFTDTNALNKIQNIFLLLSPTLVMEARPNCVGRVQMDGQVYYVTSGDLNSLCDNRSCQLYLGWNPQSRKVPFTNCDIAVKSLASFWMSVLGLLLL